MLFDAEAAYPRIAAALRRTKIPSAMSGDRSTTVRSWPELRPSSPAFAPGRLQRQIHGGHWPRSGG